MIAVGMAASDDETGQITYNKAGFNRLYCMTGNSYLQVLVHPPDSLQVLLQ
ncbi:hypothetical protein SNE25_12940 [Mucilaginibacter sabulilitoris]|uniref:Uncharacterized protein n=1 Tax=Mucilaginibacter sabulilitoris TaxID=1173583 RepID=A0ABZ0TUK5_9SPHI|nr:hypothetical protein [Mucilaginibacter sabulilitoris]WPU96426.1 hypothetical protein SNE25_12940 [Mucilaginibacter sabulilitoris]